MILIYSVIDCVLEYSVDSVVSNTSKVLKRKQITTVAGAKPFSHQLFPIHQREKKNCQENIDKSTGIYHTRSSDGASYRQEVRMDIRKEKDPLIRLFFKYGISCLVFSYLIMLFFPRKQFIGNSIGVSRAVEIVSTEMFA